MGRDVGDENEKEDNWPARNFLNSSLKFSGTKVSWMMWR